ncbi:hypothetical protein N473_18190 [Pseudoalteromonas luteoviolacea CPMOR-1]|uniref:Uncharacterized protein n=2 Tax=Pseudoalteromonas luteoviolacea TaxID=43657 RepID=A0A167KIG3_9GAMM|nr:hypothetical protein N473_18190 [Pseudoalteromonas luteoviolacea CPMOR-1]
MVSSAGFSEEVSIMITRTAGVAEVLFGLVFFFLYKHKLINVLNILGLIGLLIAVYVLQPQLLIEAFNPVTTNIPLIALSYILLKESAEHKKS